MASRDRKMVPGQSRYAAPESEAFPEMRAAWDTPAAIADREARNAAAFQAAERNGRQAAEAFFRSRRYIDGWLAHADARTGLIPRNLFNSNHVWNAPDAAADNYPFMVLAALMTAPALIEQRMEPMLRAETALTSRVARLPDDYSFKRQSFLHDQAAMGRLIFGAAEYSKDGLLPLTEWMGPSPWRDRMVGLVEDIWAHAEIPTPFGKIPSESPEVNGELLQLSSRLYWMTGQEKFLDWAVRLGDYYLLGNNHPTRDFVELKLRDHGCEVVGGLSELYVAVHHRRPEKKREYREPMHAMLDDILARGRNTDGMLYNTINPKTGEHVDRLADTWGYTYNAFYSVFLIDNHTPYRDAVRQVLASLPRYRDYDWENGSADGIADAIEGALNLMNRESSPTTSEWIDHEIRNLWAKQYPDGIIEGWHGDGNFTRTTLMYALWKTQGVTVHPWRPDFRVGAVREGEKLHLRLEASSDWNGKVRFDGRRHREYLRLPLDYPRINQFPEWFVVEGAASYRVTDQAKVTAMQHRGDRLLEGIEVQMKGGTVQRFTIAPQ